MGTVPARPLRVELPLLLRSTLKGLAELLIIDLTNRIRECFSALVQTEALPFGSAGLPIHVDRECFVLSFLVDFLKWVLDDVNEAVILVFVAVKENQFS